MRDQASGIRVIMAVRNAERDHPGIDILPILKEHGYTLDEFHNLLKEVKKNGRV